MWLWCSRTSATPGEVDRWWQAFLRRFDLEHTFRLFKQVLGWTVPKVREPAAADRWTWLIISLPRPAAPRPCSGRGPAPPLGTARPARAADPGPRPPGVPEHPRESRPASRCTETRQTRPRPPTRVEEPPPCHPLRRGENDQEGTHAQDSTRTCRLNGKLSECLVSRSPVAAGSDGVWRGGPPMWEARGLRPCRWITSRLLGARCPGWWPGRLAGLPAGGWTASGSPPSQRRWRRESPLLTPAPPGLGVQGSGSGASAPQPGPADETGPAVE